MNKLRITYVIPTLNHGGAERQLLELCSRIDTQRFEPRIILLTEEDRLLKSQYGLPADIRIHYLTARGKYNPARIRSLRRQIQKFKPHIIQSYLPTANFWTGLASRGIPDTPFIAGFRGLHHDRRNKWYWADHVCFNYLADHILVNSNTVRENCTEMFGVDPGKIACIRNGVVIEHKPPESRQRIRRQFAVPEDAASVISSMGRLDNLKGFEYLIRAMKIIKPREKRVHMIIAGSGPLEQELRKMIRQMSLDQYVHLPGKIESPDLLYSITDVFALATLSEGCPNVVLEAMAAALPVVTTSIAANREIIRDQSIGQLVPPKDPEALAAAITACLDNDELRIAAGKRARDHIRQNYSMENMVTQHEDLYDRILSGKELP